METWALLCLRKYFTTVWKLRNLQGFVTSCFRGTLHDIQKRLRGEPNWVWIMDFWIKCTERFLSGYARSSSLNVFVKNKSVKYYFTCSFEVKTHAICKNRAQTKIQQQHNAYCHSQHNKSQFSFINDLQTKDKDQDCFKSLTIRLNLRYWFYNLDADRTKETLFLVSLFWSQRNTHWSLKIVRSCRITATSRKKNQELLVHYSIVNSLWIKRGSKLYYFPNI